MIDLVASDESKEPGGEILAGLSFWFESKNCGPGLT